MKTIFRVAKESKLVMFFLAFFAYFSFYLCRTNMPYVSKTLINLGLLDITKWGLLVSYGAIVYGVSKGLSGMLADKFDLKKLLLVGLGTTSLINFIVPQLKSSTSLICFWVLNQLIQGMAYASCVKTVLNWYGQDKKTRAYGYWSASHRLGTSVVGFIVTICIACSYWQGAFIIPASITFLMFLCIILFYKQKPDNDEEKNKETKPNSNTVVAPTFKEIAKEIFTNRNLLVFSITSMGIHYTYFFILSWLVIFFTDHGFSITKSTGMLSFMPLLGCFGGIASGHIVDGLFKGRILPIIVITLVFVEILIGFLYFGCTTLSTTSLIFIMLLLGFFTDIPQILGNFAGINFVENKFQGTALGFTGFCQYIGVALSGVITAKVVQSSGWGMVFLIVFGFLTLSLVSCLLLFNQEKIALGKRRNF